VPSGLEAVFSQVGQKSFIDLTWNPDTDRDLAGYNVYRRAEGMQALKINSGLLKTPAFRDDNVQPGMKYIYSVSAVDVRNNESARSEEAPETVPK
jgi:fibronectin type 3 domain-containing protein